MIKLYFKSPKIRSKKQRKAIKGYMSDDKCPMLYMHKPPLNLHSLRHFLSIFFQYFTKYFMHTL